MPEPILIATLLRQEGETGVQSHFRAFRAWAQQKSLAVSLVTPYNAPRWQVYPVFALRRLVDPLHKQTSVWWYRHWHAFFLRRALRAALSDGGPCTIYAQCPLSAAAALYARCTPLQRVVMAVHFNISQADEWVGKGMIREGGAAYCAMREFEADVLSHVDGLVFVSDFMRREVGTRIPATAAVPYRIVPNFLPDPEPGVVAAQPATDLICIGTLESRKNQRYALEIVAAATRFGRPLTLTVVGDGPERQALEALASELGICKQVTFVGFVKDAVGLMPQHAALLHVARMESFGIVLIEAMAHGLPVFVPAAGGMPEVFNDGVEGRLIPLDDASAAARLIIEWLDDEGRMQQAGEAARRRFLGCFEASNVAANLAQFLHDQNMSDA